MKFIFSIYLFFFLTTDLHQQKINGMPALTSTKTYHYLALGDSYTIGEMVTSSENFPGQVSKMLRQEGLDIQTRIIAKTGWTTDELETGIQTAGESETFLPAYDFVTLLIGVNNQYRGRSAGSYQPEFENLLKEAIHFAGDEPGRVVVLSIPDWGVTPFAKDRNRIQIAKEIDDFNEVNKAVSQQYHVPYIDITPFTREAATDGSLLAEDGLHPSAKEYKRWAEKLADIFKKMI
jgi:lysophospholipase L1-like esterase